MGTQLTARVDDDFAELVDNYRDRERMESQSEAVRELLRIGLKEENAWFETATDGGRSAKEWAIARLSKWADRSMYASIFAAIVGVAIGLPVYFNWVEATLPMAVIYILSMSFMAVFAAVGGLLSIIGAILYMSMGAEWRDALPWRRPA